MPDTTGYVESTEPSYGVYGASRTKTNVKLNNGAESYIQKLFELVLGMNFHIISV
jgi:hypothetical protein